MPSGGLGRGLSSLIPKKTVNYDPANSEDVFVLDDSREKLIRISPDRIDFNPYQPRQDFSENALNDLVSSIREQGIIQPLLVTKNNGRFELIAGERRLRSARILGLKEIPVIVREANEQKKLEIALIENLQREDLNPIETALAYRRLIEEFSISQEEVASRVGKARPSVTNSLRLLNLPAEIRQAIAEKRITEGHAKYLLGLEGEAKQLNVFKKILRNNLTVSETDKVIKTLGGTKSARPKNYADQNRGEKLASLLGTKVEIKRQGAKGKLIIDFNSEEELNGIIDKINGSS
ncbi:MAG: ParB/RepB/Spo0J family partition protein [Candidatus Falkowbacteria bacterium]|nr:ParB/RepB/Spo0J family partition protein [Candidatus Falkowbacteria bacterium]